LDQSRFKQTLNKVWLLSCFLMLLIIGCGAKNNASPSTSGEIRSQGMPVPTKGTPINPPRAVADFTLQNQENKPFKLSELRGKPVLVYFGYTFCPDVCPTTLAEMVRVKRDLGEKGKEVGFLFISVDGERDTTQVIARYLTAFDKDFIGLTGDEQTIRRIGADYGIYFKKQVVEGTSAAYLVDHSAATYLLDREGRLAMIYNYGTPHTVMSKDVLPLLP